MLILTPDKIDFKARYFVSDKGDIYNEKEANPSQSYNHDKCIGT